MGRFFGSGGVMSARSASITSLKWARIMVTRQGEAKSDHGKSSRPQRTDYRS